MIELALLIIGIFFIIIGFPLMKMLEKQGSRWSNLVLVICLIIGIVCVGLFAGL